MAVLQLIFHHSATSFCCAPERRAAPSRQLSRVRKMHGGLASPSVSSGVRQSGVFIWTHVIAASLSLIPIAGVAKLRRHSGTGLFDSRPWPQPLTVTLQTFLFRTLSRLIDCAAYLVVLAHTISPEMKTEEDKQ